MSNEIEVNECPICGDELDHRENAPKPLKKLNVVMDANGNEFCGHEFHQECINRWMNTGQQTAAHQCPICRTDISPDQWPEQVQQQIPQFQQQVPQIPVSQRRLQQVIDYQIEVQTSVPFLGVVVCFRNRVIKTYLNTEFNLTTNNTLGELKAFVLSKQDSIIRSLPRDFVCSARNLASRLTRGYIPPQSRDIQITNVIFTTPSQCSIPGFSNLNLESNIYDNLTLDGIYRQYQEEARNYYRNSHFVRSVYNNYTRVWDATGQEDPGIHRTNYFLDPNGPVIPERFRPTNAEENEVKASRNSIAWLCFNIDCVRRGGKTRKNKKRKQTKKRKSNKRKSNKRKSNKMY
jgi:hypothetical protein